MSNNAPAPPKPIKITKTHHKGPLPDPELLGEYAKVAPELVDELYQLALREQTHRMQLEHNQQQAQLKQQLVRLYLSAFITIVAFLCAVYLALNDQAQLAGLFVGITLVSIIGHFLNEPSKQSPSTSDPLTKEATDEPIK